MQLQHWTLTLTRDLDRLSRGAVTHALDVGRRGGALRFAMLLLTARRRLTRQAGRLRAQLEQAMAAHGEAAMAGSTT
jgi:hypothetical protein